MRIAQNQEGIHSWQSQHNMPGLQTYLPYKHHEGRVYKGEERVNWQTRCRRKTLLLPVPATPCSVRYAGFTRDVWWYDCFSSHLRPLPIPGPLQGSCSYPVGLG